MKIKQYIVLLLLIGSINLYAENQISADKTPTDDQSTYDKIKDKLGVNLLVNQYWDDRDFTTLAFILSRKDLFIPNLDLWGFTDLHSEMHNDDRLFHPSRSFSEYRLTYNLPPLMDISGIGIQGEYNYSTPSDVDIARFGLTYKFNLPEFNPLTEKKSWLQLRYFPLETDGDGTQSSLIFNIPIHDKITIGGFADYNIHDDADLERWVVEAELRVHLHKRINLLLEYRYNEYERFNPNLDGTGFAVGLGFVF